jgi:glycolate oxidase
MLKSLKREFVEILGTDKVTDSPEDLVAYSYDGYTVEHTPDLVVFPESTRDVAAVMEIAHREKVSVTPRGSGTNIAGETIPLKKGIVLVLSRMDKIVSIDKFNLSATVQPGVVNYALQKAVAEHGLMYPPDPASWMAASIGGNVATNAGGPKTVKYGVTRDYLLGLTVVLADGSILNTDRMQENTGLGYDLTDLICGSEGTLGIVTEIKVRLIPKPSMTRTLRASFQSLDDCGKAVAAITREGIVPVALELMDKGIVSAVESVAHMDLPIDAEGMLLIELDGEEEALEDQVQTIEAVLRENQASEIIAASDEKHAESLWRARRAAFAAMASLRPNSVTEDATVPVSNLAHMIRKTREIGEHYQLQIGVLAHAGDGNLHPLICFDQRNSVEVEKVEAATEEIFREALAVGGTLSGEHGIGLAKAPFLHLQMDQVAMDVTRNLKEALDPTGILNPGKFV